MKWFYNLKISAKLLSAFIMVALIAGIVGYIGIKNIKEIDTKYTALWEEFGIALGDISSAEANYQLSRIALRDLILEKNIAEKNKYVAAIKDLDKSIDEDLAKYEKSIRTDEGRKEFARLKTAMANFAPVRERIISLALANQGDQALAVIRTEGPKLTQDIGDSLNKLEDLKVTKGRERSNEYSSQTASTVNVMAIIVFIAIAVAITLGIFIARQISNPLGKLVIASDKIAGGDLDVTIDIYSKDETGLLAGAFHKMADHINEVMSNISSSSEQVAAASRQVSDSSQSLSQGSTEQAASVEELTASLEEIASQTKQNALNANHANELAITAKDNAARGNSEMSEMLHAMEEINDSSANISKIIKVIDEIAFQTNILALNAAVEAARAGQHGKGFAVVAEEVRNLAARSANAAKETTDMIEGSIKKVEAGTKIANETADALIRIVDDVTKAAALVADIASASNEQATAIAQINQGISQVSQVTQTNSATAEESAAASQELSSQAEVLRSMVTKFKLKKSGQFTGNLETLRPDIIKMLENMSGDRNPAQPGEESNCLSDKTANSKIKISLGNNDFGKY